MTTCGVATVGVANTDSGEAVGDGDDVAGGSVGLITGVGASEAGGVVGLGEGSTMRVEDGSGVGIKVATEPTTVAVG